MSKFLNTYKKLLKKVQTIQFYSKIFERITRFLWAKERMSNSLKKEQFAHSLFYHERPEQIANGCSFVVAHDCSFVLSDLSKSLTVAHLTSANWVNERMINQPYKSFTILPFLAFNSLRFFYFIRYCIFNATFFFSLVSKRRVKVKINMFPNNITASTLPTQIKT